MQAVSFYFYGWMVIFMKKCKWKCLLWLAAIITVMMCIVVHACADDVNPMQETGVWLSGTLGKRADNDRVKYDLTLATSGTLTYEFRCTKECAGISITPKGDNMFPVLSSSYIKEGNSVKVSGEVEAGVYCVTIINDSTNGRDSGYAYRIDFKQSGETYGMPNNEIFQASGPITIGTEITGHFAINDREDIFRLVLAESGRVTIQHSEMEKVGISVHDGQDNPLNTGLQGLNGDRSFQADLAPGTYYLVFSQVSDFGIYKFVVNFKPSGETYTYANNSIAEVQSQKAVELCKTIKGQLAVNDEYDYFKIEIPVTGNYRLTVGADSTYYTHGHPFSNNSLKTSGGGSVYADYINTDQYNPPIKTFYYKGLKKGTYYLCFYDDESYSKVTGPYNFVMKPAPLGIYTPQAGKKSFTVTWDKGTGSGYEIQYSLKKDMKSAKTKNVSKAKTTKLTVKKLKAKKTYYVRIRSYIKSGSKKYYSDWSKVVKVKTKK